MEAQQALRPDMYLSIHKALRARLFETSLKLGAAEFSRGESGTAAVAFLKETLSFLKEHGQHEATFFHPALAAKGSSVHTALDDEHARIDAAMEKLEHQADAVAAAPQGSRDAQGVALYHAFNAFLGDYLAHMRREDTEGNAALWAAYSDPELMALAGRLRGSIPPPRMAQWLVVMLPTMTLTERVQMYAGIRANAPPPAFEAMSGIAKKVLGGDAWNEIAQGLG